MSNKKKVISDSIFIAFSTFLLRLKGLIFIPFIVKGVGLDSYGAFVQILVNKEMVTPFVALALGHAFNRYSSQIDSRDIQNLRKDFWTVIWATVILSFFGMALIYFTAPLVSRYVLSGTSLESLRFSCLLILSGALWDQVSKYIGSRKQFKIYAAGETVVNLAPYLAFTAGILIARSLLIGLICYFVVESLLVITFILWIIHQIGIGFLCRDRLKIFFRYSWALVFSDVSGGILSKVDRYFIGIYGGPAAIGMYNIVYSACNLLDSLSAPFVKYFAVYLPNDWDRGLHDKVYSYLREGLLYYTAISLGALSIIAFTLNPFIKIIMSKDITKYSNAEGLIIITGIGIISLGCTRFFYQLLKYKEKNFMQLIFQAISAFTNFTLNLWLVKKYGILGAGISTFISYFLILILCNWYLKVGIDLKFTYRIIMSAIAASICAFVLSRWSINSIVSLICALAATFILYGMLVLLFKVITFREIKARFL